MYIENKYSKDDYNNEPVFYCKSCLSLLVKPYSDNINYCDDCGSTNIGKTHIVLWENMYFDRYKIKLIDK